MKLDLPAAKKFVHAMTIPIRWGDMDAMGHVNNTVYFRYLESARIEWLLHRWRAQPGRRRSVDRQRRGRGCLVRSHGGSVSVFATLDPTAPSGRPTNRPCQAPPAAWNRSA
jgi:hypothetical protein